MRVNRVESRRPSNSLSVYLQRSKKPKVNINFAKWNNPNNESVKDPDWKRWASVAATMDNAASLQ